MEINFTINGEPVTVDVDEMMPLLWVVRDELDLKGKPSSSAASCVWQPIMSCEPN